MSLKHFFNINTGSSEPIYRQLVEQVRRRIAAGQLTAGDEMPSVRDLAQVLAVNPMTISKAYALLENEGALMRRRGLPMVVAAHHQTAHSSASRIALLRPSLERVAAEVRQLEIAEHEALQLFAHVLKDKKDA